MKRLAFIMMALFLALMPAAAQNYRDSRYYNIIGKHLQMLAEKETTGGQYKRIGEIYGFPVKIAVKKSGVKNANLKP